MRYLLDTCVISELSKPAPAMGVVEWVAANEEADMALSVLTLGEIQRGVSRLRESKRRNSLQNWLDVELCQRFAGKVLSIDENVARTWGMVHAEAQRAGRTLPTIDSLIGATALVHNLTVVTRNEADIRPTGARILNPWKL